MQRRVVRHAVAGEVERAQSGERAQGGDVLDVVVLQCEGGEAGEAREGGDIADGAVAEAEHAQFFQRGHGLQVGVREGGAGDGEALALGVHALAADGQLPAVPAGGLVLLEQGGGVRALVRQQPAGEHAFGGGLVAQRGVAAGQEHDGLLRVVYPARGLQRVDGGGVVAVDVELHRAAVALVVVAAASAEEYHQRHDDDGHRGQRGEGDVGVFAPALAALAALVAPAGRGSGRTGARRGRALAAALLISALGLAPGLRLILHRPALGLLGGLRGPARLRRRAGGLLYAAPRRAGLLHGPPGCLLARALLIGRAAAGEGLGVPVNGRVRRRIRRHEAARLLAGVLRQGLGGDGRAVRRGLHVLLDEPAQLLGDGTAAGGLEFAHVLGHVAPGLRAQVLELVEGAVGGVVAVIDVVAVVLHHDLRAGP